MNLFDNKTKDSKLTDIFSTKHSRDYYRGKSFNFAGEWAVNNHYISDDYRVDFVTYKDTLLSCKKSHLSDVTLEPSGFIYDEDSGKTIGIVSEYWEFVLSGLNEEILNNYVLIEDLPVEKGSGKNSVQQKGTDAEANGDYSHAEGVSTITENHSEHAEGQYNKPNKASDTYGDAGNTQHSVGIGTSESDRKNAFEIMQNGDIYVINFGGYDGTNPNTEGVQTLQQGIDRKYTKPSTGIPASDLAEGVIPDVSQFITRTVNDLANYYLKNEIYTKDEVVALIGAIQQFHYEVYASLPETGAGNVLYLIGPAGTGSDRYEEYVYANGVFTKIGDTSIDLSGYVTTQALNAALADYTKSVDIPVEKGSGYNSIKQKGTSSVASTLSTALGLDTKAYGSYSHAEGDHSQASGIASHAEGSSQAHKDYSHSEGQSTDCHGRSGHVEGAATSVAGDYAHAEGDGGGGSEITIVSINENVFTLSSVDGLTTDSVLKYDEFYYRIRSINTSENTVTVDKPIVVSTWDTGTREKYGVAFGIASHVEGRHGVAFGVDSHVEGNENVADGNASHAEGYNTRTRNDNEHAEGQYNKSNHGTIHSVGIGTSESDRKNAFEIMQNGDAYLKGIGGYDGTNPTVAQTIKQVIESRESSSNKTTSISRESTDQQYPSAKAVYDSFYKRGVVSQTQTWTQAADGGYDYVMSNLVYGDIPRANIDLFESAGAVFNETTGYFELNGLADISYEEMQKIYNRTICLRNRFDLTLALSQSDVRTNFMLLNFNGGDHFGNITMSTINLSAITYASSLEIVSFNSGDISYNFKNNSNMNLSRAFRGLKIRVISGVIPCKTGGFGLSDAFDPCYSLESVQLYGIKSSLTFTRSARLSVASILYMINNESATSAITITLHPTAYARATADADITAALANHPNVTLASA